MNTFNGSPTLRPNIDALTSLRFFAAMYVLLFHFGAGFSHRAGLPVFIVTFLENGWFGVSAFFVLSGFILTYTYRDGVIGQRGPLDFAIARVARIYPVYLLALIIALPLLPSGLELLPTLKTLALVQAWGPVESSQGYYWITQAWSLSVEMFFYVLFPSLIFAFRRIGIAQAWAGIVIVALLMVGLATPPLRPAMLAPALFSWMADVPLPIYRLLEFLYGIFLCKLFLSARGPGSPSQASILIVSGCLIILLSVTRFAPLVAAGTLLIGVLIYQLAKKTDGPVNRVMSSRVLVALGGASYAIYILHGPIREWVRVLIPSPIIGPLIYPFVVVGVSLLVFFLYEQPVRKFIRRVCCANASKLPRDGVGVTLPATDVVGQTTTPISEDSMLIPQELRTKR